MAQFAIGDLVSPHIWQILHIYDDGRIMVEVCIGTKLVTIDQLTATTMNRES